MAHPTNHVGPGLAVSFGDVHRGLVSTPTLDQRWSNGGTIRASREHAVVEVPGVAAFSIRGGSEVVIDPVPDAEPEEIRIYRDGLVTVLALAQQGRFALHANVIGVNGTAIALAGHSGAGKTTTSLVLRARGYELHADDLAVIEPDGDALRCTTTARSVYVQTDTAARLSVGLAGAQALPRLGKFALPIAPSGPRPVRAAVVLAAADVAAVEASVPALLPRAALIAEHLARGKILRRLWPREAAAWTLAVTARLPVHVVRRPSGRWTADSVADAIERLLAA